MISQLKDKKAVFFDVGYTLCAPASGDWMLTRKFLETAGGQLRLRGDDAIRKAVEEGLQFLVKNHLVTTVEAETEQFTAFYMLLSDRLDLGFSRETAAGIARDRAFNMDNYVPYPGIVDVMRVLSGTHKLGVISDTWPSIGQQLKHLGVSGYLSFGTFSCFLGTFKPDPRMYLDALEKSGDQAREAVFIDDSVRNLEGAAALGITPILIAAGAHADAETDFLKIRDLRELIYPEA